MQEVIDSNRRGRGEDRGEELRVRQSEIGGLLGAAKRKGEHEVRPYGTRSLSGVEAR